MHIFGEKNHFTSISPCDIFFSQSRRWIATIAGGGRRRTHAHIGGGSCQTFACVRACARVRACVCVSACACKVGAASKKERLQGKQFNRFLFRANVTRRNYSTDSWTRYISDHQFFKQLHTVHAKLITSIV